MLMKVLLIALVHGTSSSPVALQVVEVPSKAACEVVAAELKPMIESRYGPNMDFKYKCVAVPAQESGVVSGGGGS